MLVSPKAPTVGAGAKNSNIEGLFTSIDCKG